MENRGDVKSGCKGVLLRNSGRNSGMWALGTDSGRTGSVRTLELKSGRTGSTGRSEGASDACVFFADADNNFAPRAILVLHSTGFLHSLPFPGKPPLHHSNKTLASNSYNNAFKI